jgi:hypothetical protein
VYETVSEKHYKYLYIHLFWGISNMTEKFEDIKGVTQWPKGQRTIYKTLN